jgi:hypothetical protein
VNHSGTIRSLIRRKDEYANYKSTGRNALIVSLTLAAGYPRPTRPDRLEDPTGRENTRLKAPALQGQLRASQVIGMEVRNEQNEDLGKVQDLIVDSIPAPLLMPSSRMAGRSGLGEPRPRSR